MTPENDWTAPWFLGERQVVDRNYPSLKWGCVAPKCGAV